MTELVNVGLRPELWIVPAAGVLLILLAIFFVWLAAGDELSGFLFAAAIAGLFGVGAVVVWLVLLVPYQAKYHFLYHVDGTVASVSNVLTEASGELTQQPIVTLDGIDASFAVNDSRAVTLTDRDVTLLCSIEFVYLGADRYNCVVAEVKS
jgi:hypothetical protein